MENEFEENIKKIQKNFKVKQELVKKEYQKFKQKGEQIAQM